MGVLAGGCGQAQLPGVVYEGCESGEVLAVQAPVRSLWHSWQPPTQHTKRWLSGKGTRVVLSLHVARCSLRENEAEWRRTEAEWAKMRRSKAEWRRNEAEWRRNGAK